MFGDAKNVLCEDMSVGVVMMMLLVRRDWECLTEGATFDVDRRVSRSPRPHTFMTLLLSFDCCGGTS